MGVIFMKNAVVRLHVECMRGYYVNISKRHPIFPDVNCTLLVDVDVKFDV